MKNIPILTFFSRSGTWLLLAFCVVSSLAVRDDALFQKWGMLIYIPAIISNVMFFSVLVIHLFFRETIDRDVHCGTYVQDWRALTPSQRVFAHALIRIGIIIGFCILCAGLARGGEPDQEARWQAASIRPNARLALDSKIALYERNKAIYQRIQAMRKNGVPAPVIFGLHYRESDNDFRCHPHEGSPLTHRTRYVPKGRLPDVDPPYTFEQSAEDAYYVCDHLDRPDWCHRAVRLQAIESFNGLGYQKFHPDIPSPYLWSGTSIYSRGKYTADGRFDRLALDKQLGVAAILKRMEERGICVCD